MGFIDPIDLTYHAILVDIPPSTFPSVALAGAFCLISLEFTRGGPS